MRLAAACPRTGTGSGLRLRVSAVARPSSPQRLSTKRAAAAVPPPSRAQKSERLRDAARGPMTLVASASSPSLSSSSSSGDEDDACDVYVTPDGEVVEVGF